MAHAPSPDQPPAIPPARVSQLADHLFRHEAGKLVSVLTRIFGLERLELAEDVVQEALARALQTWPYYGIPENPAAWLTQTARNLALDVVRREKRFRDKQPAIAVSLEQWTSGSADQPATADDTFSDDRLRLMFACCHPVIPLEAQTALALKTLCGFSPTEIARAFLTTEVAVNKRLTRARQQIRAQNVAFEIPSGPEAAPRLDAVRQTLYLLFNEGYKASSGNDLVREELCREAIRLGGLLVAHPVGDQPSTHALIALMLFNAARLPTRVDREGNLLRLEEQDRSRWNRPLIDRGLFHLSKSAAGEELSGYHLQAAIAACHCMASDYASTDWRQILAYYDQLIQIDASPVIALNRAVAVARVHGAQRGIDAINAIPKRGQFASYHLLHAVLGELEWQLQRPEAAAQHWRTALKLATLKSERDLLNKRLRECEAAAGRSSTTQPDGPDEFDRDT